MANKLADAPAVAWSSAAWLIQAGHWLADYQLLLDWLTSCRCTSAVSVETEEDLYRAAAEMGISCISISQRLALTEFHAQELHLGAPNPQGWTLTQIAPVDAPSEPEDNDLAEMTGDVSPASSTVDLSRPAEDDTASMTDEDSENGGVLVGG